MNFIFSANVCMLCLACNVKKPQNKLTNSLKISETSVVLLVFDGVHAYTVTVSYLCSTSIRYQTSYINVIFYNKHLSSQCNLNAQIEPVQYKVNYYFHEVFILTTCTYVNTGRVKKCFILYNFMLFVLYFLVFFIFHK